MASNANAPARVLQQVCTKRKHSPPVYTLTPRTESGKHLNNFEYEVKFLDMTAIGNGSSKQIAKHAAAYNALMMLKEAGIYVSKIEPFEKCPSPTLLKPQHDLESCPNYFMYLQDICDTHKIFTPVYNLKLEIGPGQNKQFTYKCNLLNTKLTTVATGSTNNLAKQLVAKDMLENLKAILPEIEINLQDVQENVQAIGMTNVKEKVLQTYNDLYGSTIPDKSVNISDNWNVFNKNMAVDKLIMNDVIGGIKEHTEKFLKKFAAKLGIEMRWHEMQQNPYMLGLLLTTDTPISVIGKSTNSLEEARQDAIKQAFRMITAFIVPSLFTPI